MMRCIHDVSKYFCSTLFDSTWQFLLNKDITEIISVIFRSPVQESSSLATFPRLPRFTRLPRFPALCRFSFDNTVYAVRLFKALRYCICPHFCTPFINGDDCKYALRPSSLSPWDRPFWSLGPSFWIKTAHISSRNFRQLYHFGKTWKIIYLTSSWINNRWLFLKT